ncbi:MAG: C39 family peptidase [Caldilineaceae bacterium]|nr:C39 family peptidase [Caldilineaceae bacterium]
MKLNVNFVSQQQGPGERQIANDCGPACLSAITGAPIEKIYQVSGLEPGKTMHMQLMLNTLRAFRIPREHIRPLHLPDARRWLANGNPIVALINYGRLPRSIRATDYAGNHFVILVGYEPDGAFWVHDPLWPGQEDAYRRWTDAQLGEAWANPIEAGGLQGIVIQRPFPVLEATTADVLPLVVDVAGQQATVYLHQLLGAMEIEPGPLAERQGHALARIQVWKAATKNP